MHDLMAGPNSQRGLYAAKFVDLCCAMDRPAHFEKFKDCETAGCRSEMLERMTAQ
jgi:hypothetical protein